MHCCFLSIVRLVPYIFYLQRRMDGIESLLYKIGLGGIIYLPILAGGAEFMKIMINEY